MYKGRWLVAVVALLAACPEPAVVGADAAARCTDDSDCPSDQLCRNRACQPRVSVDGGVVEGGVTDLAGRDRDGQDTASRDGSGEGIIQVSPADLYLEFGGVRIGTQVVLPVTVSNVGGATLRIFQVRLRDNSSGEFSSDVTGTVNQDLAPGHDLVIQVTHTASDGVADRAYLGIVSSDAERSLVEVELYAEFKGDPVLGVVADRSAETPEVTAVDFGEVPVGQSGERVLYLKNIGAGDSALTVSQVRKEPGTAQAFTVTPTVLPTALSRDLGACSSEADCGGSPRTCAGGVCYDGADPVDVVIVTVRFTPSSAAAESASLVILHDGSGEVGSRTLALSGAGVSGQVGVAPSSVNFGNVFVGFPQQREVTISNGGGGQLDLTSITLGTGGLGFTLVTTGTATHLAAGESTQIGVVFGPATPVTGAFDMLIIQNTDVDPLRRILQVPLLGNGLNPPDIDVNPAQVAFGDVHVKVTGFDRPGVLQLEIGNSGTGDLSLQAVEFTRPAGAPVPGGLSAELPGSTVVTPGATAQVTLRFAPLAVGDLPSDLELRVRSNDPHPGQGNILLPVTGRGVDPDLAVSPVALTFAATLGGTASELTLRISNNGAFGPLLVLTPGWQNMNRAGVFTVLPPAAGWPLSVNVASEVAVTVRYSPPSYTAAPDTATLVLQSNDIERDPLLIVVTGVSTTCPAKAGAQGVFDSGSGLCTYDCLDHFYDLDDDLAAVDGSCEYECYGDVASSDVPDSDDDGVFTDANCDGLDGDKATSVFVAETGNAGNTGAYDSPLNTISGGIAKAQATGTSAVLVASGIYPGEVTVLAGISVYGGYDPVTWQRSYSNLSILQQSAVSAHMVGLRASSISTATEVDGLVISVDSNGQAGGSTYGVYSQASGNALKLSNLTILAGNGGVGQTGSDGSTGTAGTAGSPGGPGCDGCDGGDNSGARGSSDCSPGGKGGRGGYSTTNGAAGVVGTGPIGGTAGAGGASDGSHWCVTGCGSGGDPGGAGGAGGTALVGTSGSGGNGTGSVVNYWVGSNGGAGIAGGHGSGGGGGGGGGGTDCCQNDQGGGGGGGGGGGCAGGGGTAGTAGGGSFGLFLVNSSPTIRYCSVSSGRGGNGGAGSRGGSGGTPGGGGLGGAAADNGDTGGAGGSGSAGGAGGCGGGGGGGLSYAIYRHGTSSPASLLNTLSAAGGGSGGAAAPGCGASTAGSSGQSGTSYP